MGVAEAPSAGRMVPPSLTLGADGRLEVFTVGGDRAVWRRRQTRPAQGPWGDWQSVQAPDTSSFMFAAPTVAQNRDGRLELFRVAGEAIWHCWQSTDEDHWSRWQSLDAPDGQLGDWPPEVARNQDGRLDLIVAAGGGLWHHCQASAGSGPWEPWQPLYVPDGGIGSGPMTVGMHADGRLVLMALTAASDGPQELWQVEQTAPNKDWAGKSLGNYPTIHLEGIPRTIDHPTLVTEADGRLSVFFLVPGTMMQYFLFQDVHSGSGWLDGYLTTNSRPDHLVSRSRHKCSETQRQSGLHAFDQDRRQTWGQDVAVLGGTGHPGGHVW